MKTRYADRVTEESIQEPGQVNCVDDNDFNAGQVVRDNIIKPNIATETSELTGFLARFLEEQKAQTLLLAGELGTLRQQIGELKSDECRPIASTSKAILSDSSKPKLNHPGEAAGNAINPK